MRRGPVVEVVEIGEVVVAQVLETPPATADVAEADSAADSKRPAVVRA